MARVSGKGGNIYVGVSGSTAAAEPVLSMKKWSADFKTDRMDATAFGDTNKVYVAGLPDGSGSFEGYWDDTNLGTYTAATDGVARRFYLYPKTPSTAGPYWYGTAFFDFSIEVAVDGIVSASGTFSPASSITRVG